MRISIIISLGNMFQPSSHAGELVRTSIVTVQQLSSQWSSQRRRKHLGLFDALLICEALLPAIRPEQDFFKIQAYEAAPSAG